MFDCKNLKVYDSSQICLVEPAYIDASRDLQFIPKVSVSNSQGFLTHFFDSYFSKGGKRCVVMGKNKEGKFLIRLEKDPYYQNLVCKILNIILTVITVFTAIIPLIALIYTLYRDHLWNQHMEGKNYIFNPILLKDLPLIPGQEEEEWLKTHEIFHKSLTENKIKSAKELQNKLLNELYKPCPIKGEGQVKLPTDIWKVIFNYLSLRELDQASQVCKHWKGVVYSLPYLPPKELPKLLKIYEVIQMTYERDLLHEWPLPCLRRLLTATPTLQGKVMPQLLTFGNDAISWLKAQEKAEALKKEYPKTSALKGYYFPSYCDPREYYNLLNAIKNIELGSEERWAQILKALEQNEPYFYKILASLIMQGGTNEEIILVLSWGVNALWNRLDIPALDLEFISLLKSLGRILSLEERQNIWKILAKIYQNIEGPGEGFTGINSKLHEVRVLLKADLGNHAAVKSVEKLFSILFPP